MDAIYRLLSETFDVDQLGPELNMLGIKVTTELVEEVLKNSYKAGEAALKFFHWFVNLLGGKHSPYAWNLLVDVLGNNKMFDAMWDAAKSMKVDGILSRQTFATIFTSYAVVGKANEAMMTFEAMMTVSTMVHDICQWNKLQSKRYITFNAILTASQTI